MTTAILTITCPHCGGRIENVRSTSAEQTIACPFCRTDLHIPHVGTERVIVREVIHELGPEISYEGVLKPTVSAGQRLLVAICSFIALFIMFGVSRCHTETVIHDMDACEASCKDQCANAGDHEAPDQEGEVAIHDTLVRGDQLMCETHCEQAAKCWSR